MQQWYQCPRCGAQVAFGVGFCNNCGTQLNWPTQQQPPPQYQQQYQPPPQQPPQYQQQYQQPQYQQQYQQPAYQQQPEPPKKKSKLGLILLVLGIILLASVGSCVVCVILPESSDVTLPPPSSNGGITLADASTLLDMSANLPARFQYVNAASEGMSNQDMGLGPDFSEVELFVSDQPFQMIFAYLYISKSNVESMATDALMRDEEKVKSLVLEGLLSTAAEESIAFSPSDVELHIAYPSVGNLAVQGTGTINVSSVLFEYSFLMFRCSSNTYVFIVSLDYGEGIPLIPLATGINERIEALE